MRIAVISDTHGRLEQAVEEQILACDAVLHAGDFDDEAMYRRLTRSLTPFLGVRGNCDWWAYGGVLPDSRSVEYEGVHIFMTHRPQDVYSLCRRPHDIIICGHTHCYQHEMKDGVLHLNPGSISKPRDGQAGYCVLNILNGKYEVEHVTADAGVACKLKATEHVQPGDELIRRVMRLTDKRYTVDGISERLDIPQELTERIVRMYLTHPGVDVDGIMARL